MRGERPGGWLDPAGGVRDPDPAEDDGGGQRSRRGDDPEAGPGPGSIEGRCATPPPV